MPGRFVAVVVLALELSGRRTARADASQSGPAPRAKPLRLELTWAWPPPAAAPQIPPAGSAAVPSVPAPAAPPVLHANGAQVAMAIVVALVGGTAGLLVLGGTDSAWAGALPLVVAPFGAAAVVCKAGEARPGGGGRCRATLAGALIGAAVGLLPGMLIIASAGSRPSTEDAYHDYIQNRLSGFEVTFLLYGIAVPLGTIIGYDIGGAAQPNPVAMPAVATAPLFMLRF